eukprot:357990-Chlamydomonas_euryale.AAC.1
MGTAEVRGKGSNSSRGRVGSDFMDCFAHHAVKLCVPCSSSAHGQQQESLRMGGILAVATLCSAAALRHSR